MPFLTGPTLAGFNVFVRQVMQIDPLYLPTDSPLITYAYQSALMVVNPALAGAGRWPSPWFPGMPMVDPSVLAIDQWSVYAMAVYNLGGSNVVNYAQDQPGRVFFKEMRANLGLSKFTPGVVAGTSDQGTAVSYLNPEFMKEMTLANLQQIKDPWGRAYLMIAQDYGGIWGIS